VAAVTVSSDSATAAWNDPPAEPHAVLALCGSSRDLAMLGEVSRQAGWEMHAAGSYREAVKLLCFDRMPVMLCDCSFRDGTWLDIISHIAPLMNPPRLIVMCAQGNESLWSQVLNMGGFDVLLKPLNPDEVMRVVSHAIADWQRERKRGAPPVLRAMAAG
jgi:DNA-binding NtrC family response regulator